jgi:hypothetical protein
MGHVVNHVFDIFNLCAVTGVFLSFKYNTYPHFYRLVAFVLVLSVVTLLLSVI